MGEYPYYDEDPQRRRRRERRRRDYAEDAWGMAEYQDYGDGSFADAEDYAAGMVDEERRAYRRYDPDRYDGDEPNEDNYTVAADPVSQSEWRSQHIGTSTEGVERAADLLSRLNERNSYSAGPPRDRKVIDDGRAYPPVRHRDKTPQPRRSRTVGDPSVTFSFAMVFVLTMALISCVALALYAAFG